MLGCMFRALDVTGSPLVAILSTVHPPLHLTLWVHCAPIGQGKLHIQTSYESGETLVL